MRSLRVPILCYWAFSAWFLPAGVVRSLVSSDDTNAVYAAVIQGTQFTIGVQADLSRSTLSRVIFDIVGENIQVTTGDSWSGTLSLKFTMESVLEGRKGDLKIQVVNGAQNANVNRQNRVNKACTVTLSGFDETMFVGSLSGGRSNDDTPGGAKAPVLTSARGTWTLVHGSDADEGDRISPSTLVITDNGKRTARIQTFTYTYTPADLVKNGDPVAFRFMVDAGGLSTRPTGNGTRPQ